MRIPGPNAENKDWARSARTKKLLPALRKKEHFRLEFASVTSATQSFMHALIAEAIQQFGQEALRLIEFHRCTPQVQETIKTVVTYSLRAREIAESILPDHTDVRAVDVPQADDLEKIRQVVETLSDGPKPLESVADDTGFSLRHIHYRINAARILGLAQVVSHIALITPSGTRLLQTAGGTINERELLKECVRNSLILQKVAPNLLAKREPTVLSIATRIERLSKLAHSTAMRRASSLIAWRRYLLEPQISLQLPNARNSLSSLKMQANSSLQLASARNVSP